MPIPTRSQSLKQPTAQARSQDPEHSRDLQNQSSGATVTGVRTATSTIPVSRIPGLEKRAAVDSIPSHARSQSSSTIGIPRPAASTKTSRVPNNSINSGTVTPATAHSRSQSVATSNPVPRTQIQPPQPITQPLARAPSKSIKPPNKIKPPSSIYSQQQHLGSLRTAQSSKTSPENTEGAQSQPPTTSTAQPSSRLDDELLQLAAVYHDSHASLKQFEISVKHKLEASESALRAEEDALWASEKQRQADINTEALWKWLHSDQHSISKRKVQDLSFCVSELSDLNSGQGLFNTCMRDFDTWLGQAQAILHQHTTQASTATRFVEPMESLWSHHVHELDARLEVCEHLLQQVHDHETNNDSALVFALSQLERLTKIMRESLGESQSISAAVLSAQDAWVTDAISTIVNASDDGGDVTPRRGVWS